MGMFLIDRPSSLAMPDPLKGPLMSQSLELYYKPSCPWCQKVLAFMDSRGITLPLHDISANAQDAAHLVEVGGKRQVPCLLIDEVALYESSDIIDYLAEHCA